VSLHIDNIDADRLCCAWGFQYQAHGRHLGGSSFDHSINTSVKYLWNHQVWESSLPLPCVAEPLEGKTSQTSWNVVESSGKNGRASQQCGDPNTFARNVDEYNRIYIYVYIYISYVANWGNCFVVFRPQHQQVALKEEQKWICRMWNADSPFSYSCFWCLLFESLNIVFFISTSESRAASSPAQSEEELGCEAPRFRMEITAV
jgi:hypothetical protein